MSLRNKNYFQIFSVPESYPLDLDSLAKKYRQLQAEFHPDTVGNGPEQERLQAVQLSSLVNEAYETLVSPTRRAAYLLLLNDVDVAKVNQSDLSPEVLLEQIQFREELEDVPRDESGIEILSDMLRKFRERLDDCQLRFARHLESDKLLAAKSDYYEMQYFYKLILDLEAVEEDLLGY